MPSLSVKERKVKTPSFLVPSQKYIMIEEFKDELTGLTNILNEMKKTGAIERTKNKLNKK